MNDGPTWPIRCGLISQVQTTLAQNLAAGCLYNGVYVAIDDGSRADLGDMGRRADRAQDGKVTWPASYQEWLGNDGVVPLPTPADGIALADACADYYSTLVRTEADLLAQIAAIPDDEAALKAFDPNAGWPS